MSVGSTELIKERRRRLGRRRERVPTRPLVYAFAAALLLAGAASASRPATGTVRNELVAELVRLQGQVGIQSTTVSTVDPDYALVRWGARGNEHDLFHRAKGKWVSVFRREFDRPADGACAFAPAKVVKDLFAVTCPPPKAVHARKAPSTVLEQLFSSLRKSALTPYWRDAKALGPACVSRLNARWAAAQARFAGTSAVIWFERKEAWQPVYETVVGRGTRPPDAVILSLASCVGYSAPDYGA